LSCYHLPKSREVRAVNAPISLGIDPVSALKSVDGVKVKEENVCELSAIGSEQQTCNFQFELLKTRTETEKFQTRQKANLAWN
jgi:hypothetical protein